jgi:DNA end-binding protein Ku
MAARSIWKGSINFGVVAIPAKMYSATDDKKVSFHQYHKDCGGRVVMPKHCSTCGKELDASEIDKGYELNKEQHITLTESDFQSLPLKSLKQIEVVQFVDGAQIDFRAYDDCYFLTCEDIGAKAFALLLKAMESVNLVGIAKLTYREREHLSALRAYNGIILLQTLHYVDELRPFDELRPRQVAISDKELELALMLIDRMKGDFQHSQYQDDYRQALETLIEAKLTGEVITAPAEKAPISDVADALIKSLELVGVK